MPEDEHSREDASKPPPSPQQPAPAADGARARTRRAATWLRNLLQADKPSNSNEQLQEVLEDYIEELKESDLDQHSVDNQKELITNVLNTRGMRVDDIMVPRADIVAIEKNATLDDLKKLFAEKQFSRLPVYEESLDRIVGCVHIKDILNAFLNNRPYNIAETLREVMIVYPGLPVMDLFKMLREDKKHMAIVIDEHGGVDGLVTINDIVEAIVGDLDDEFDGEDPQFMEKPDGSVVADARVDIDDLEEIYGRFIADEEREDIETLGGLAFHVAGHIPQKGDILNHVSGVTIEILDADSRRIKRVRLRNLPARKAFDEV